MRDGLVVVDKAPGWTSHDVVARVRRLAGTRRVGHAGTLDPMATGVLVLGVDRATRLLTYLVGADKEYVATHAVGMDKVAAYVLGEDEEGIPKTPAWASKKCGVPEWTIKALAREFASKTTSIIHYFGGSAFRGPYSHEPGRLDCTFVAVGHGCAALVPPIYAYCETMCQIDH